MTAGTQVWTSTTILCSVDEGVLDLEPIPALSPGIVLSVGLEAMYARVQLDEGRTRWITVRKLVTDPLDVSRHALC